MKSLKYMFFLLPFVFAAGCISGQAVVSLNKDGSGKVSIEGLFDYPLYCADTNENAAAAEKFFTGQLKTMVSSGGFEAWDNVSWKILDDKRCYFKGTAYFRDINKIDFFLGSAKTGVELKFANNLKAEPTIELRLKDNFRLDRQIRDLPPEMFKTFNMNLVAIMPSEIKTNENFQRLDEQTVSFVFSAGQWLSYIRNNRIRAVLASDGNDLFDYEAEISSAQKNYPEILKRIETACETAYISKDSDSASDSKGLLLFRRGLLVEEKGEFEKAVKIYQNVIKISGTNDKIAAGAAYQIGICLIKMGRREQATAQLEEVIKNYPQSSAALKSVKLLRNIHFGESYKKTTEAAGKVFVADTTPKLYAEDTDPNLASIKISFSEPMKKDTWFYSSFRDANFPEVTMKPTFNAAGTEWTLPVKLEAGKVYAVAVNCQNPAKDINNQIGFQSISGQMCEKFVLVFATSQADANMAPPAISDELIEQCEKIN